VKKDRWDPGNKNFRTLTLQGEDAIDKLLRKRGEKDPGGWSKIDERLALPEKVKIV